MGYGLVGDTGVLGLIWWALASEHQPPALKFGVWAQRSSRLWIDPTIISEPISWPISWCAHNSGLADSPAMSTDLWKGTALEAPTEVDHQLVSCWSGRFWAPDWGLVKTWKSV